MKACEPISVHHIPATFLLKKHHEKSAQNTASRLSIYFRSRVSCRSANQGGDRPLW